LKVSLIKDFVYLIVDKYLYICIEMKLSIRSSEAEHRYNLKTQNPFLFSKNKIILDLKKMVSIEKSVCYFLFA